MSWWQTVFDGIASGFITASLALFGLWLTFRNDKKKSEIRRLSGAGAGAFTLASPEGTLYIENKSDEGIVLDVYQKRLYQNVEHYVKDDKKELDEIYRKISINEHTYFFNEITKNGNKKLSSYHLSNFERAEVPASETFGYTAENIRCVIVGTVIRFNSATGPSQTVEKLYIHRFTMGEDVPEPRARWVSIYSQMRLRK